MLKTVLDILVIVLLSSIIVFIVEHFDRRNKKKLDKYEEDEQYNSDWS